MKALGKRKLVENKTTPERRERKKEKRGEREREREKERRKAEERKIRTQKLVWRAKI